MKFGSVCSGIEAASVAWETLVWKAAWFSEIDPFCCALLGQRFPNVVNLGDVRTLSNRLTDEQRKIDVLVGGTPCQDLSVAGKRKGINAERSRLFFDFIDIAKRCEPTWIVWENVPGLLSRRDDFQTALDCFTQIGYACDVDIMDAQYFGVPQRRRRVFVVCVRLDGLLQKRTPTSKRIAAELLLQPLLDTWEGIKAASYPGKSRSAFGDITEKSANSAKKRIDSLNDSLEKSACMKLLNALDENLAHAMAEPKFSGCHSALQSALCEMQSQKLREDTDGSQSSLTENSSGSLSIDTLWSSILEELSRQKKESTMLTSESRTTRSGICIFAKMNLSIARYITDSNIFSEWRESLEDYWNLVSLLLTLIREITSYARSAT